MEKIRLDIVGLSYSHQHQGAYALVLQEENGNRRLPVVIGGSEAQSIAIGMENIVPPRPLSHDLIKNIFDEYDIDLAEVIIFNLKEGVFYAKLVCVQEGKEREIDSRTSDAIALAVRFACPIFTYEFILSQAGVTMDESNPLEEELESEQESESEALHSFNEDDMRKLLKEAVEREDYESASVYHEVLNKEPFSVSNIENMYKKALADQDVLRIKVLKELRNHIKGK